MVTGTLAERPPSTSRRPSICSGGKTSGTAMLARTACARSPEASTTVSRVTRSVATARNGNRQPVEVPAGQEVGPEQERGEAGVRVGLAHRQGSGGQTPARRPPR